MKKLLHVFTCFFLFLLKKRDYYYLKFRLISYIIIEEIRTQKIDTLHKFVIFLSLDEQKNRKKGHSILHSTFK